MFPQKPYKRLVKVGIILGSSFLTRHKPSPVNPKSAPTTCPPSLQVDMTPGVPLASGFNQGDDPQQAMDDDAATLWTANCQSCNETRKHLGEKMVLTETFLLQGPLFFFHDL